MLLGGGVKANKRRWQAALNIIGVGWAVGISILLGILGGLWLDNKFNTKPIFVIAGLFLGLVVAVYSIYRVLLPLLKDGEDKEND